MGGTQSRKKPDSQEQRRSTNTTSQQRPSRETRYVHQRVDFDDLFGVIPTESRQMQARPRRTSYDIFNVVARQTRDDLDTNSAEHNNRLNAPRSRQGPGMPTIQQTCQQIVQAKRLRALPGLVHLTTQPDCITFDDDPHINRARMPCGHVFGVDTMTMIAKSTVHTDFKYIFRCPGPSKNKDEVTCGDIWDYTLVRHVAALTAEETTAVEKKLGELYMTKAAGAQQCPGCGVYCYREDKKLKRMRCPVCYKKNPQVTDFCWACLGTWKTTGSENCGNAGCDGKDPRLNILSKCDKKSIEYTGILCPSLRACPTCGSIIEHSSGCKKVKCYFCEVYFCFVCLRTQQKGERDLPCGNYSEPCTVAQVQIVIPGSE